MGDRPRRLNCIRLNYKIFHTTGVKMSQVSSQVSQVGDVEANTGVIQDTPQGIVGREEGAEGGTVIPLPQFSGSTISNIDIDGIEPGSVEWEAKKAELKARLVEAKRRRDALKSQLAWQKDKFELELQENEARKLENELREQNSKKQLEEELQIEKDKYNSLLSKVEVEKKTQSESFKHEKQELIEYYEKRKRELLHEAELLRMQNQLQQENHELELKVLKNANVGGALNTANVQQIPTRSPTQVRKDVSAWCQQTGGLSLGEQVGKRPQQGSAQQNVAFAPAGAEQSSLVTSGINLLQQVGLDSTTANYITSQVALAKGFNPTGLKPNINHASIPVPAGTTAGRNPNVDLIDLTSGGATMATTAPLAEGGNVMGCQNQEEPQISDGESSSISNNKTSNKRKKIKSGMVAKVSENVKSQEVWPHYNLMYNFVVDTVSFKELSFEQFIAGEVRTISKCKDLIEQKGRLNLLERLSYLKHKGHSWQSLRSLFAGIVNSIERHDDTWASDWRHIEEVVLDSGPSNKNTGEGGVKDEKKMTYFCRNFNSPQGCDQIAPHDALIGKKKRKVKHICSKCFIKEGEIKNHSQNDCNSN